MQALPDHFSVVRLQVDCEGDLSIARRCSAGRLRLALLKTAHPAG
jgi:hypothetical protein